MERIRSVAIKASKDYDVLIGKGILKDAGGFIKRVKKPCRALIVTDSNVDKIYSCDMVQTLEKEGFEVLKFVIEAGEESKNAKNFVDILEFAASNQLTRSDLFVALGGGVVGDLCGFAASCYLRGIDFVQIPTTILASVDSSVGGKTAIDLVAGKNLAGAFYQPVLVLCDTDTFSTLPTREVSCGFAEIIKYAILFDDEFFCQLEDKKTDIQDVVEKCVCFKRDVVQKDEFDNGQRKLLNLGHTAAHAIEKVSNFSMTHGQAVSVGTVIACRIAENTGVCTQNICSQVEEVLQKYNLPTLYPITAKQLYDVALCDKKRLDDKITLVLPKRIGECVLKDVEVKELEGLFEEALK